MNDRQLGELALAAAELGGQAIRRELRDGALVVQDKAPADAEHTDMVTSADKAAEDVIVSTLLAVRPDDAVLAEESGGRDGESGVRWVIDPLDGTFNFIRGRRDYAVSIGAERGGEPVAGAVLRPADGEWASAGGGEAASRDGPLGVSRPDRLSGVVLGLGMPRQVDERERVHRFLGELLPLINDYRRVGSSACSLQDVACGREDLCVSFGVSRWDVAGGAALVQAAGGDTAWVTTESGLEAFLAGASHVVSMVVDLLHRSDRGEL